MHSTENILDNSSQKAFKYSKSCYMLTLSDAELKMKMTNKRMNNYDDFTGKLTVNCDGKSRKALCELRDCRDGFFKLTVEARDIGDHLLFVRFEGQDVPGTIYI